MDLTQHQIDLEQLSSIAAETRALALTEQAAQRGATIEAGPGVLSCVRDAVPAASSAIRLALGEGLPRQADRYRQEALDILLGLDPDMLAVATLNTLYSSAIAMKSLTHALLSLGATVAVEHYAALARKADRKAVDRLLRSKRPLRGAGAAQVKLAKIIRDKGEDPVSWCKELHLRLGEPLIGAVVESCGLFAVLSDSSGEAAMVTLTEAAQAELEAASSVPWVRPRLLPMVVEPQPWATPEQAPYLTEAARRWVTAVRRTRGPARRLIKAAWSKPELAPFRTALDTLGQAAFVIDQDTLAAVQWTLDKGLDIGGVPRSTAIELEAPPRERPEGVTKEQHRLNWESYLEADALNYANRVTTLGLKHDLANLRLLAGYGAIYQPHYSDFRGRLYPASSLSHHREDAVRASFRFAVPEPLGGTGRRWLARHVAGCASGDAYGKLDKAPWKEREEWAEKNGSLIRTVAENWRERPELWTTADSPFSFLSAAREWSLITSGTLSASGLLVGLDGTCSGLQHYAAALRSPVEGALVNLTPGDRPSDVYAAVAARCVSILTALCGDQAATARDRAVASLWLDYGITRSTVKRQTMTFAYSSEVFGFRKQLWDDLVRPLHQQALAGQIPRNPLEYEGDQGFAASLLMAKTIWRALSGVVEGAASGMAWIKDVSSLLAKHERPVTWDSPSGFPVYHAYKDSPFKQVRTFLGRRQVQLAIVTEEGPKLLPHKQRSAAAPNVIHSLDAAHLHLTTAAMANQGVAQLAMIHDSFGCPPGHVETLATTLRREFVGMYERFCIFEELHRRALEALPEEAHPELPAPPAKGTLDIAQVLDSDYVFC